MCEQDGANELDDDKSLPFSWVHLTEPDSLSRLGTGSGNEECYGTGVVEAWSAREGTVKAA